MHYIASQSVKFTKHYRTVAQKPEKACADVMSLFRFPSVTYLTSSTFKQLGEGLAEGCKLLNQPITEENAPDLHALYYVLQITLANIRALNYCDINLSSLLPKEADYSTFMAAFQGCVKKLAEESDEDFSKRTGSASEKVKELWKSIAEVCQKTLSESLRLFYKSSVEILESVHSAFKSGQGHKSLAQLNFLSQVDVLKGIVTEKLEKEGQEMTETLELFEAIVKQDREIFQSKLKHLDINKPDDVYKDYDLQLYETCQKFAARFG